VASPAAFVRAVREEVRLLDGSPQALRRFGLVVGGVLAGIGAVVLWRRGWALGAASGGLLGAGAALVVLGAAAPRVLRPVFRAWMTLAFALGFVMTRVILTLVFFLLVTPIGVLRRTLGTSPIRTRPDPTAPTYWLPRPPPEGDDRERLGRMY
jgi:hypothetical protein